MSDKVNKDVKKDELEKGGLEIAFDWFKKDGRTGKMFGTFSAFAIGVVINVLAKGFTRGFNVTDIWDWSSLVVGFSAGLGIPAVQNNAIISAILTFMKNKLFIRYRSENITISDKITNKKFRRFFVKKTNENDLKDLREKEFETQTEELKSRISNLHSKMPIAKNPEKLQKQIDQLESELKDINENGVDVQKLGWEPMEINDVFNFENSKGRIGKKSLQDNSAEIHKKKNIIARFYMPVVVMVLQGSALSIIKDNLGDVFIASFTFLLILIYTWFSTKQSHLELKEQITLPVEKNRNDLLKDAEREYDEWKKINEIVIDFSGPLDQKNKDDLKKNHKEGPKVEPLEVITMGTFGNRQSTTKGDLPIPGRPKEFLLYKCIVNSFYSTVAKKRFKMNDVVIMENGKWTIKKETK